MRKTLIIFTLTILARNTFGQDIHYSQLYLAPMINNPALAGAYGDIQAGAQFRDQWQTINTGLRTFGVSADMRINKNTKGSAIMAAGLNAYSDQAGDGRMSLTKVELPIACQLKVSKENLIGVGVQFGFGQRSFNPDNLTWGNQYDGTSYNSSLPSNEGSGVQKFSFWDAGVGISWVYNSQRLSTADNSGIRNVFGASMLHVNQPLYSFNNNSSEKLLPRINVYNNFEMDLPNSKFGFMIPVSFMMQGPSTEIMAGVLGKYQISMASRSTGINSGTALYFGGSYRVGDAFAIQTMFEYDKYQVGIAYDMNISDLSIANSGRGGFEVMFRFILPHGNTASSGKKLL